MRHALGVEYDGSGFSGWQRLNKPGTSAKRAEPTVQETLETALSFVADAPILTVCAGRTDAGVHATCQVVHSTASRRDPRSGDLGTTRGCLRRCACAGAYRSPTISMHFTARVRGVTAIACQRGATRAGAPYLGWIHRPLDADAMHRAAQPFWASMTFPRSAPPSASPHPPDMQLLQLQRTGVKS